MKFLIIVLISQINLLSSTQVHIHINYLKKLSNNNMVNGELEINNRYQL